MNNNQNIEELWNKNLSNKKYTGNYPEHLLEQYKLYVEMADRVSHRRNQSNSFFLSLHTFILGIIGFALKDGPSIQEKWVVVLPLIALLTLCYMWSAIVKSHRQLNTGKFLIINEIEKALPIKPYSAEWVILEKGTNRNKYWEITLVENWVPVIFANLYIVIAIIIYFSY